MHIPSYLTSPMLFVIVSLRLDSRSNDCLRLFGVHEQIFRIAHGDLKAVSVFRSALLEARLSLIYSVVSRIT